MNGKTAFENYKSLSGARVFCLLGLVLSVAGFFVGLVFSVAIGWILFCLSCLSLSISNMNLCLLLARLVEETAASDMLRPSP